MNESVSKQRTEERVAAAAEHCTTKYTQLTKGIIDREKEKNVKIN